MSFVFLSPRSERYHWVGDDGRTACTGRQVIPASFTPWDAVEIRDRCRGGGCLMRWRQASDQRARARILGAMIS